MRRCRSGLTIVINSSEELVRPSKRSFKKYLSLKAKGPSECEVRARMMVRSSNEEE